MGLLVEQRVVAEPDDDRPGVDVRTDETRGRLVPSVEHSGCGQAGPGRRVGAADFFDYLDFIAAYEGKSVGADFNGDNEIDFFDNLDFVAAFELGC
jgi:hypothetical protein